MSGGIENARKKEQEKKKQEKENKCKLLTIKSKLISLRREIAIQLEQLDDILENIHTE